GCDAGDLVSVDQCLIEIEPVIQEFQRREAALHLDQLQGFSDVAKVMRMHERFERAFEIGNEVLLERLDDVGKTVAQVVRINLAKRIRHRQNRVQFIFYLLKISTQLRPVYKKKQGITPLRVVIFCMWNRSLQQPPATSLERERRAEFAQRFRV